MRLFFVKALVFVFLLAFTPCIDGIASVEMRLEGDSGVGTIVVPKSGQVSQLFYIPDSYLKSSNILSIPLIIKLYDMEGSLVYSMQTTNLIVIFPDLGLPVDHYQLLGKIGNTSFKKNISITE